MPPLDMLETLDIEPLLYEGITYSTTFFVEIITSISCMIVSEFNLSFVITTIKLLFPNFLLFMSQVSREEELISRLLKWHMTSLSIAS